jgi:Na+/proline symporter
MVAGFATAILWVVFLKASAYDLYEMIPGCLVGTGVTIAVSLMTRPDAEDRT